MNRDELIDTIQRLLALSSSANEHESQMALARANKLMAEHNISMMDVNSQKSSANYSELEVYIAGRSNVKDPYLCSILQDYFFVKAVYVPLGKRKTSLHFFGDKVNVEIAKYVYKVLDLYFGIFASANKIKAKYRRAYYSGMCNGFKQKLKEERDSLNQNQNNRNALILVDKQLVEAFQNRFTNLKSKQSSRTRHDADSYNKGFNDGKEINLRKGLEGAPQPKLEG